MSAIFLPQEWSESEDRWLEDPRGYPSICEECEHFDDCDRDPVDCENDALDRAVEARWEASREAWD